jgi:hypothetical protein
MRRGDPTGGLTLLQGLLTVQEVARKFEFIISISDSSARRAKLPRLREGGGQLVTRVGLPAG